MSKKFQITKQDQNGATHARSPDELLVPVVNLREEINRAFADFFADFPWPVLRAPLLASELMQNVRGPLRLSAPRIKIVERDDAYELTAELSGLGDDEIDVSLSGEVLTIRGEKKQTLEQARAGYQVTERRYGGFCRCFKLPEDVDADRIEASIEHGVVTISLPKTSATAKR